MSQIADKELIIRLRNDDKQAFSEIFWLYHSAIYNNVLRLIKNNTIAEDLVQDVFLSLWEQRKQLDSAKALSGWLFVVSYHMSVDFLKQKQKESVIQSELQYTDPAQQTEEADKFHSRSLLLEKAISHLSPQKRKVYELCRVHRKSYQQAADDLKLSRHTVKEYLSEASASVKNYIRQCPEEVFIFFLVWQLQSICA